MKTIGASSQRVESAHSAMHLYGVVRDRADSPFERLVLNAPFIHDDNLVANLEEFVQVDIVQDVDLDH